MDASVAQVLTALIGIGGTLGAAIFTQIFQRQAERERRNFERERYWVEQRFQVFKLLVAASLKIEELALGPKIPSRRVFDQLYGAGFTEFHDVPPAGVAELISATELKGWEEGLDVAVDLTLNRMPALVGELFLLADQLVVDAARALVRAADEVVDRMITCDGAYIEAVPELRLVRERFQAAVRAYLGAAGIADPRAAKLLSELGNDAS
ncbi:hypothetical protein [Acrocarpospora catenulata]|uniref:hypothetical protein n=1 Tax=Acrocarpospora catenulata TaxID=2836182 RepID=UPI001BDA0820|nr:hypothetical protein [Acrocarpospora catenulata]